MKSLLAGSIAAAIAVATLAASPSHAQPTSQTLGLGQDNMAPVHDVDWQGRRTKGGVGRGAPAFRGGARAFRGGGFRGRGAYAYRGGGAYYRGDGYRYGGAAAAGIAAGALLGGALVAPGYPDQGDYGGSYYAPDSGYYAVAPAYQGSGSVAYCESRFRSYDPSSGTYQGNDGLRYACP